MTYSHLDAMHNRVASNAGKTVGTRRPLTQKQIWAIRFFLVRPDASEMLVYLATDVHKVSRGWQTCRLKR